MIARKVRYIEYDIGIEKFILIKFIYRIDCAIKLVCSPDVLNGIANGIHNVHEVGTLTANVILTVVVYAITVVRNPFNPV